MSAAVERVDRFQGAAMLTSALASTGAERWKVAASRHGRKSSVTMAWYGSSPVVVAHAVNCWTGFPFCRLVPGE